MNMKSNLPTQQAAPKPMAVLKDYINRNKQSLMEVIPKHLNAERMAKLALVAASRQPLLLQCTPESILRSVMDASALGLEPNTGLGLAYLVPYKNNKAGVWESQFIPSYKGLVDLARRSGNIISIEAHVVRKADKFECEFGLSPKLVHVPAFDVDDAGPVRLVYAVARLADGGTQAEVMTMQEINKVRTCSRAGDFGPWKEWPEEMAKKTVVKRLCKMLPLSTELQSAIAADNAMETGESFINVDTVSEEQIVESSEPTAEERAEIESKMDAIAGKIGG